MPKKDYRLVPELVPEPLWERSVYHALKRRKPWKDIRQTVIDEANSTCSICGEKRDKGMYCHEVWDYDDSEHIATLVDFSLSCPMCNHAHHIGMTSTLGGDILERTIDHLKRINNMTDEETDELLGFVKGQWVERSMHQWEIRIDEKISDKFPVLKTIEI
jgi:hypothetical protein